MSGRKPDAVWKYFNKKKEQSAKGKVEYSRAECKICKKDMAGLVKRMRDHYETCSGEICAETESRIFQMIQIQKLLILM